MQPKQETVGPPQVLQHSTAVKHLLQLPKTDAPITTPNSWRHTPQQSSATRRSASCTAWAASCTRGVRAGNGQMLGLVQMGGCSKLHTGTHMLLHAETRNTVATATCCAQKRMRVAAPSQSMQKRTPEHTASPAHTPLVSCRVATRVAAAKANHTPPYRTLPVSSPCSSRGPAQGHLTAVNIRARAPTHSQAVLGDTPAGICMPVPCVRHACGVPQAGHLQGPGLCCLLVVLSVPPHVDRQACPGLALAYQGPSCRQPGGRM